MKRKEEKINSKIDKKLIKGGIMLQKINLSKIIVFVLLLTMIAAILVSDTYSRFTTTASGSDSVVVAKWSFKVNGEEIAVKGDAKTIEFGLFDTIYDSDGETEESNVEEGFIAPGTSGNFEFALQNTSEVTTQYEIKLDIDNTEIPLEFSFDGEEWKEDLTNLMVQDVLEIGASKNVKVMWRWQFRDDVLTDIEFADQTVNVTASITAIQVEDATNKKLQEYRIIDNKVTSEDVSLLSVGVQTSAPYTYHGKDIFAGKTLSKIGIPVKSVSALDENQTFTLYVIDSTTLAQTKKATVRQTYTLKLPKEQLGNSTTVDKYVYVDLTDLNITLAEDETLAFYGKNDSIKIGYIGTSLTQFHLEDDYQLVTKVLDGASFLSDVFLAFEVYAVEETEEEPNEPVVKDYGTQLFTDLDFTTEDIARFDSATESSKPFAYQDTELFSGKTITKIGIPVLEVSALDENQKFTLYVIDKTKLAEGASTTIRRTYTLKLPLDQLGNSTTVNKYVYVDLIDLNITLAEDETLAFYGENDTIQVGYICNATDLYVNEKYNIATHVTNKANFYDNMNFVFDIYAKDNDQTEETTLKSILTGKNFSILGDSISTYKGYSDDATNTNSTIGSNASHYGKGTSGNPVTNVNATWWKQAADQTGMNVLVNNSYSGDSISVNGITRATQLHDDTGNNSGTNPDIVAVYMGINDVKNDPNLTATEFAEDYTEMITNIKTTYPDADIFVFTLLPYTCPSAEVTEMGAEEIEVFNQEIRNVAASNNCTVVDLFNDSGITEDNYMSDYIWDYGLHPNEAGMDAITNTFINALSDKYLNN